MKRKKTKNNKQKTQKDLPVKKSALSNETKKSIAVIVLLTLAFIFALAGFNLAGNFGELIYSSFYFLFGYLFWAIPVVFLVVSVLLFKSLKKTFELIRYVGAGLAFISVLALVEILIPGSAGKIGSMLASPLVYAFDRIASFVVALAGLVIGTVIFVNTHPFAWVGKLFKKQEEEQKEPIKIQDSTMPASPANTQTKTPVQSTTSNTPATQAQEKTVSPTNIVTFNKPNEKDQETSIDIKTLSFSNDKYTPPPLSLLNKDKGRSRVTDVKASATIIKRTLANFGVSVEIDEVSIGPTVTRYAIKPAEGTRLEKIVSLRKELELDLATSPVRIEAPIPGKALVGIEVPNTSKVMLGLGSMLAHPDFAKASAPLLVALGKDITGKPYYGNVSKMPHLLVAGTTGAGKSVTMHNLIVSLLYRNSPEMLRLMMIDPKKVEFTAYNDIPHLLTPVITDAKLALRALKWLVKEMERRYEILEKNRVRDISSYHKNVYFKKRSNEQDPPEAMPYIVLLLDEMADLMQQYKNEVESAVVRLAQMSRAVGIHLILATQRPDVRTITGLIKANIPTRLALKVAQQVDSRTIIDSGGAEKLLGKGDMLFKSADSSKPMRLQAPYISEEEVEKVVSFLKKQYEDKLQDTVDLDQHERQENLFAADLFSGQDDDDDMDPKFAEAKALVIEAGKASTTYIQRKLRVGYARAASLMDALEAKGVIGPAQGSKPREVLIKPNSDMIQDTETSESENASPQSPIQQATQEREMDDEYGQYNNPNNIV